MDRRFSLVAAFVVLAVVLTIVPFISFRATDHSAESFATSHPSTFVTQADDAQHSSVDGHARNRHNVESVRVVELRDLAINRSPFTDEIHQNVFRDYVFAVLSDGVLQHRLQAALTSWLQGAAHTFVYFSDLPESRRAAPHFEQPNVTVVFLRPPPAFRFGNWKNFPIVKHLADPQTSATLHDKLGRVPPWFVIVDDDTYLLAPAVDLILRQHTEHLERHDDSLYLGHTVVHCQRCKTASKRFPFAFGGNGIFLSRKLVRLLGPLIDSCAPIFSMLPGDEQIGGCIHRHRLAPLRHMSVGTETFSMAFGDKRDVLLESPFPFAFHRIKFPEWHADMRRLEQRYPGRVLRWDVLARYFLEEKGHVYNTVPLIFQEDVNASWAQAFLRAKGLV